jgi:plastocyanin
LAALLVLWVSRVWADVTITMVGFEYSPRDVTAQVGETITWVNPEGMAHTVTDGLGSGDPAAGLLFDVLFLDGPEQTFSHAFADTGVYSIFCRFHEALNMTGTITVVGAVGTGVPVGAPVSLASTLVASPNPVRDSASLSFYLAQPIDVRIDVYDPTGRRVREVFRGPLAKGQQIVTWDGRAADLSPLPSGVYLMRVETARESASKRVVLVR